MNYLFLRLLIFLVLYLPTSSQFIFLGLYVVLCYATVLFYVIQFIKT